MSITCTTVGRINWLLTVPSNMSADWQSELEQQREQKEQYFASHPRSPIPNHADFAGLDHYPIDPDYRFELELHEHDDKEQITVETTADGSQQYVRYGEFRFEIDGEDVTLQAYQPVGGEDRLWVPFRDETNDEETYGAGRYIDLEPEHDRTDDGTWILDLNEAYNPTCAYNEAYECPLIPMENWLDIPVRAGEKAYPGEPVGHSHH
ncbi:DUF1684 family [Halapricum desulfuricans]|uniref:DUF1684 family n=2 Tax=Halapricum desulfuricans TaxID=2841257 RepID=A0A897N1U2_9EURY|nr:DUF1684 family [Halapricum desulfuricans]